MISLNKFRLCALQSIKCTGCTALTFPRTLLFVHHVQTVATEPQKADIITNLSEKLCCTENVAKNIYIKFPLMRSVNLINDETLTFLRTKVSPKSIVENPTLITTDVGKSLFVLKMKEFFLILMFFFRHFKTENQGVRFHGTEKSGRFCSAINT